MPPGVGGTSSAAAMGACGLPVVLGHSRIHMGAVCWRMSRQSTSCGGANSSQAASASSWFVGTERAGTRGAEQRLSGQLSAPLASQSQQAPTLWRQAPSWRANLLPITLAAPLRRSVSFAFQWLTKSRVQVRELVRNTSRGEPIISNNRSPQQAGAALCHHLVARHSLVFTWAHFSGPQPDSRHS